MSTNFLNAKKGLSIIKSDNNDIPFINVSASGTATSTTLSKLIDSTKVFTDGTVKVGDILYNTTSGTAAAKIISIDSATTLSLNADVISSGQEYTIYQGNQNEGCLVYVGGTGDINCVTAGGSTLLFKNVAVGILGGTCPIQVKQILSTSTSATLMLGLW